MDNTRRGEGAGLQAEKDGSWPKMMVLQGCADYKKVMLLVLS